MTLPIESYKDKYEEIKFYSFGTIFILKNKKQFYSRLTTSMLVLGICVPIASYSLLIDSNQISPQLSNILKFIFYILGLFQIIISIISLAYRWEDKKTHADKAIEKNLALHSRAADLSQSNIEEKKSEILELWREYKYQETLDISMISVSRKEEKRAMIYTLYSLELPCAKCNKIPKSLSISVLSSKCDCCGQNKKEIS